MYINVQTLQFVSQHVEKEGFIMRTEVYRLFQAWSRSKKCDCFIIPQKKQQRVEL